MKKRIMQLVAEREGITLCETVAAGDGANDRQMVYSAGLGIAYRTSGLLRKVATCRIDATSLESILPFANVFAFSVPEDETTPLKEGAGCDVAYFASFALIQSIVVLKPEYSYLPLANLLEQRP